MCRGSRTCILYTSETADVLRATDSVGQESDQNKKRATDTTTAISIFLTQAVATNGFPFEIKRQIESNPYAPMTEAEMLAKLEKSREQGMFRDADLVVSDMRLKYGL